MEKLDKIEHGTVIKAGLDPTSATWNTRFHYVFMFFNVNNNSSLKVKIIPGLLIHSQLLFTKKYVSLSLE